jgi:hypothetical protein
MVIRYRPRKDTSRGATPNCAQGVKSWYWVEHTLGDIATSESTPSGDFNKGFVFDAGEVAASNAVTLQTCGTAGGYHSSCSKPPTSCQFDDDLDDPHSNPSDSVPGNYCCDETLGYCSYRCINKETFACPAMDPGSGDFTGFPGGFDPCQGWPKACFAAEFEPGTTPETTGEDNGS